MEVKSNSPLQVVPDDYCPSGTERWFEIPSGLDKGKKLFYFDYATPGAETEATVLFIHGNPECSYTYRESRKALTASATPLRIIGVDNIGFGISDQATFEMVDMHHSANLRMLIDALDLKNVILVIHDWGGPIGIGAFVDQMHRVEGLVVLNSTIFPMPSDGMTYSNGLIPWLPWRYFPYLTPNSQWGGLAAGILQSCNPGSNLGLVLRCLRMQYKFMWGGFPEGTPEYVFSESLRSAANAKSSKRNVLQTPWWGHGYSYADPTHGVQDNHAFYAEMQAQVAVEWGAKGRNIPAAGHFGKWDPCGKDSAIGQWTNALPSMAEDLHEYPEIGHFVEEEKGAEIAESIIKLVSRRRVAAQQIVAGDI